MDAVPSGKIVAEIGHHPLHGCPFTRAAMRIPPHRRHCLDEGTPLSGWKRIAQAIP